LAELLAALGFGDVGVVTGGDVAVVVDEFVVPLAQARSRG